MIEDYKEESPSFQGCGKLEDYEKHVAPHISRFPIDLNQLSTHLHSMYDAYQIGDYDTIFEEQIAHVLSSLQKGNRSLLDSSIQQEIYDLFAQYHFPEIMISVIIECGTPKLVSDCIEIGYILFSNDIEHPLVHPDIEPLHNLIQRLFEIVQNPSVILVESQNSIANIRRPATLSELFPGFDSQTMSPILMQKIRDQSLYFIRNLFVSVPEVRTFALLRGAFGFIFPIFSDWDLPTMLQMLPVQNLNTLENALILCGHMLSVPEILSSKPVDESEIIQEEFHPPIDIVGPIMDFAIQFFRVNGVVYEPTLYLMRCALLACPGTLQNLIDSEVITKIPDLFSSPNEKTARYAVQLLGTAFSLLESDSWAQAITDFDWTVWYSALERKSEKVSIISITQISHFLKAHFEYAPDLMRNGDESDAGIFDFILKTALDAGYSYRTKAARFYLRFLDKFPRDLVINLVSKGIIELISCLLEETDSKISKRLIRAFEVIASSSVDSVTGINEELRSQIFSQFEEYDVRENIELMQDADDIEVSDYAMYFVEKFYTHNDENPE